MIERVLLEYLANALWQIPLLAGGAWIFLWMVGPRPWVQHWVWLAVLGLAVLLPLHGMGAAVVTAAPHARTDAHGQMAAQGEASGLVAGPVEESEGLRVEWTPRLHSVHLAAAAVYWMVALYVSAILLGLYRIARAWRAARRLVEGSRETALDARSMECFADYGRRLGASLPEIRESGEVASPMIVGAVAPVLLLPVGFGRFTEDEV